MLIKLIRDDTGNEILAQIDCPEKDVKRLTKIFELFDRKIKDFKPKK